MTQIHEYFTEDFMFDVTTGTGHDLATGTRQWMAARDLDRYLNADPGHTAILHGGRDNWFGEKTYQPNLYIIRGASERPDNFYWGTMPAEDPGDANGGDLTAAEALRDATSEYYQ